MAITLTTGLRHGLARTLSHPEHLPPTFVPFVKICSTALQEFYTFYIAGKTGKAELVRPRLISKVPPGRRIFCRVGAGPT